jgi:hypothetical protein
MVWPDVQRSIYIEAREGDGISCKVDKLYANERTGKGFIA